MTEMMKFKQRIFVISCIVFLGVLYIWMKIKVRNSRRNPVVPALNDENLLRSLLLDGVYDINNLDHVHKVTSMLVKDKRSTKNEDGIDKNTKEHRMSPAIATSVYRTKTVQDEILSRPAWELWREMVKEREVTQPGHEGTLKVKAIVKALQTAPVQLTSVGYRGTQLKATMFLNDNQRTVFKPKRLVVS